MQRSEFMFSAFTKAMLFKVFHNKDDKYCKVYFHIRQESKQGCGIMVDLLSGGVTRGLVSAATSMKTAQVCMTVYSAAKARGDEATMKRALGYASDNIGNAMDSTEESRTALAENVKTAREEEKAEQAARLEKARQDAAEKRAETQTNTNEESTDKIIKPTDVIEISPEAVAALQNERSDTAVQSKDAIDYSTTQPATAKQKEKPIKAKQPQPNTQVAHIKIDSGEKGKIKHGKLDVKI